MATTDKVDWAHGTQTCGACGGYKTQLGVLGRSMQEQCKSCGDVTSKPLANRLEDFLAAGDSDYR